MDTLAEIYRPLDTVEVVNTSVKSPTLRKVINWVLLVTSVLFLLAGAYAMITYRSLSKITIEIYLIVLVVMLIADGIALYFESRSLLKTGIRKWMNVVSITITVVVAIVAFELLREQLCHFTAGRRVARVSFALIVLKMALALVIAIKSGHAIKTGIA